MAVTGARRSRRFAAGISLIAQLFRRALRISKVKRRERRAPLAPRAGSSANPLGWRAGLDAAIHPEHIFVNGANSQHLLWVRVVNLFS